MPRRPPTQPSGLSRERILQVALAIAEREGIESLSMRRLAQELDVWPMSVYRYFQDKDALLDAMAAGAAAGVTRPSRSPHCSRTRSARSTRRRGWQAGCRARS
jgi:AcrR family transcriptional regulator